MESAQEKQPGKEGKGGGDPTVLEGSAFEALERDFQQVLQELVGDKSLERFRTEYEKLHRALKKSHESEKRLVKKARELNAEIVQNAQKVQTALKLSQEDQNTIGSLKREIEKAWKMVDAAHDKEGRAKDTIGQLKVEIANLSRLVEQGAGLSIGQENTVSELMKVKNDLMRERDNAIAQVQALRLEIADHLAKTQAVENDAAAQQGQIEAFREQIATRKSEAEKEALRKERLESELRTLRDALEERQTELRTCIAGIAGANESSSRTEHLLRDERARTDRSTKELDALQTKNAKQAQTHEELTYTAQQLVKEGAERALELRMREEELSGQRKKIARVNATIELQLKRAGGIEHSDAKLEAERLALKASLNALELKLVEACRLHDLDRKAKDALTRERDLLNKQLVKSQSLTHKQVEAVRIHEGERKNLEQEIAAYKGDAHRVRKSVLTLEREREKLQLEVRDAAGKHGQAVEELHSRESSVVALQRRIGDVDNKLKQQQNLYEAVRADRNLYNKNLLEARDEIGEMLRKFKIMHHQIEQLKDEIRLKDQLLVREHFEHMKVAKEKDALKDEVSRVKKLTGQADETIANYKGELSKLGAVIGEADTEVARQQKEQDIVTNERDLLGLQLIRRNEELGLLYEKIRIHEAMLRQGEQQFTAVSATLVGLHARLSELRAHVTSLRASVVNVSAIHNEAYHLARELMHERTKVRALESELGNPLNVHRWRKLEGSDPAAYEMIQKIQVLQKRLIAKSTECVDRSEQLTQKDRLYTELKRILARQPGPEIAEQLAVYRSSLREKDQQSDQMSSELTMYHAQVTEYKAEIERIVRELHDVKVKFFEQKRKEQAHREKARSERTKSMDTTVAEARSTLPRFTGGGFSLQRH